jgi:hypothetical protein
VPREPRGREKNGAKSFAIVEFVVPLDWVALDVASVLDVDAFVAREQLGQCVHGLHKVDHRLYRLAADLDRKGVAARDPVVHLVEDSVEPDPKDRREVEVSSGYQLRHASGIEEPVHLLLRVEPGVHRRFTHTAASLSAVQLRIRLLPRSGVRRGHHARELNARELVLGRASAESAFVVGAPVIYDAEGRCRLWVRSGSFEVVHGTLATTALWVLARFHWT